MRSQKKYFYFILLLVVFTIKSYAQVNEIPITLYETTTDFLEKYKYKDSIIAIVQEQSTNHLKIKNFLYAKDKKKFKKGLSNWAVELNGIKYFNLGYSGDLNNWHYYTRFDVIGKYCLAIISEESPKIIQRGTNNYGGNLTGILIHASNKWGKNWVDKEGKKKKILFIDSNILEPAGGSRYSSSLGNLLTKDDIERISKDKYPDLNISKLSFEEVIELIKKLNE